MNFPSTFSPIGLAVSRPSSLLAHLAQLAIFFLLPHRSRARKLPLPAGLAPPPWSAPTTSTEGKKLPRHPSFISPLNGALSPIQSPSNRRLQPESIEAPSTPAIEGTRPPPPRLRPTKGHPAHGEDPHTSNTPSLSPHWTHATALPSRGSTADARPPCRIPSLGISQIRLPVAPSFFSPPRGKPLWPRAAARPTSGELHGQPWWPVHHRPHPALVHKPWTESMPFPITKKFENRIFQLLFHLGPCLFL
jgi:hypothetical protein